MTNVEIGNIAGTDYTWDSTTTTWDCMLKPWNEANNSSFSAVVSEPVSISDRCGKRSVKSTSDTFGVADKRPAFVVVKAANDIVSFADTAVKDHLKRLTDGLYVIDAKNNCFRKSVRSEVGVADKRPAFNVIVLFETLVGVAETYWDNVFFSLRIAETTAINDVLCKSIIQTVCEFHGISDELRRNMLVKFDDNASFTDSVRRRVEFIRLLDEVMIVAESTARSANKNVNERLDIIIELAKTFTNLLNDEVEIADSWRRTVNLLRKFDEGAGIDDVLVKKFVGRYGEQLAVFDDYVRACGAVLSNITVQDGELTVAEFLASTKTPPGYDEFTEYKVGDYEYQQALVRLILQACAAQSEPLLSGVNVHVDIDDVDDRGVVVVEDTSAAVKVYYNKHYYTAPEVNITVKGGNTSTGVVMPTILATDGIDGTGRFFIAELRDISGNRCVGTFAWVSKGY